MEVAPRINYILLININENKMQLHSRRSHNKLSRAVIMKDRKLNNDRDRSCGMQVSDCHWKTFNFTIYQSPDYSFCVVVVCILVACLVQSCFCTLSLWWSRITKKLIPFRFNETPSLFIYTGGYHAIIQWNFTDNIHRSDKLIFRTRYSRSHTNPRDRDGGSTALLSKEPVRERWKECCT